MASVTISISASATASSALYVAAGKTARIEVTGTWVGEGFVQISRDAGASYSDFRQFTANFVMDVPVKPFDVRYRVLFKTRASGTMTGTLSDPEFLQSRHRFSTVDVGSVAYGSLGTNTTPVAGTWYYADIRVTSRFQATGIAMLNGGTVGTNKWVVALFDATGRLITNSAVAGATTSGANAFQTVDFLSKVTLDPGIYFVAGQLDGTTDRLRTAAASTFLELRCDSVAGTFGTIPATIVPPTAFSADEGPVAYLY